MKSLAAIISTAHSAADKCKLSNNPDWRDIWVDVIDAAQYEFPRGSGFDRYPVLDMEATNRKRLVITGSYHQMDEHGSYDGWCDYTVYVWPDFEGIRVTVKGGGRNNEYIGDIFYESLSATHDPDSFRTDLTDSRKPS